jgi:hypothetical protein
MPKLTDDESAERHGDCADDGGDDRTENDRT